MLLLICCVPCYKEFAKLKRENRKNNVRTSRKEIGRSIGNCDDPADEVPPLGAADLEVLAFCLDGRAVQVDPRLTPG